MALRRPVYLDAETLMALSDYHDLDVAQLTEVVEKSSKKRSAKATAGWGMLSGGGELGKDVELQTSYTIEPSEKATVSKVIDGLIAAGHTVEASPDATLQKDDIIEVEGEVRLTAASLAGKMLYVLRKYLESTDQDIRELDFGDVEPEVLALFQSVYLGNELVPIPLLVDVAGTELGPRVLVNLRPNLFVESAMIDQIEGERRILGTIRNIVEEGNDGYLSTENWLLSGWEYLLRRMVMTQIDHTVQDLVDALAIDLPAKDVHAWISGPAIILDAVAIY
ncbi:DUF6414 family protein [Kocuria salsicia]|uniref:DUF6414 family protein n=1 Tax=Kocuria salsicia TaxID=664639 RepID=UPI000B0C6FFC|nr:hypothetical protein [Kocuria salsicia]